MSPETYERHLMPLLLSRGITPLPLDDVLALSDVTIGDVIENRLFQRMIQLYRSGRDDLAFLVGEAALRYRKPDVWFQGGWGLLSIANRVGRADDFSRIARIITVKLQRRPRLAPEG